MFASYARIVVDSERQAAVTVLVSNAVDLDGRPTCLRLRGGVITERAATLAPRCGEVVVDARGCTVVPGLHDHHVHTRSAAAALHSIQLGPSSVSNRDAAVEAVRTAQTGPNGWIRGVGYHESVAGDLDRDTLDTWRSDAPLRVQHRSGALWILNSAGLRRIGEPGHRDGRLFRRDADLVRGVDDAGPDLKAIGECLSSLGVTGCTDATPNMGAAAIAFFDNEIRAGRFRQRLHLLAHEDRTAPHAVTFGPVKRILDDTNLDFDDLVAWIHKVHGGGQSIAVHCVTVAQLVLTTAALRLTGLRHGDRIEHAAMIPDDALDELAELGVTVVTSPNFIAERGDRYLRDIDARDHHQLWRVASVIRAGILTACGTDAPFGNMDPWACMRAARSRSTASGAIIGAAERVDARRALTMFLGDASSPSDPRRLAPGRAADLCILDGSPETVLGELSSELVRGTIIAGEVVFGH